MTDIVKKRAVLKGLVTKAINKFWTVVDNSGDDTQQIEVAHQSAIQRFGTLQECHIECLINDGSDSATDTYLDDIELKVDKIRVHMRKLRSQCKEKKSSNDEPLFRVNKLSMEIFEGEILKYLPWKEEVKDYYLPYISVDSQAIALKKLVSDRVRDRLIGCDSLTQIWAELDRIYGNINKISDKVMSEISDFPPIMDGDRAIIDFTDRLTQANREMLKYQRSQDLDNSHMIGLIERKLPPRIRSEWAEIVIDNSTPQFPNKFKTLLEFLQRKSKAMEYVADAIRCDISVERNAPGLTYSHLTGQTNFSDQSSPCIVHFRKVANHRTDQCNVFLKVSPVERRNIALRAKACFKCLARGHQANSCAKVSGCFVPGCSENHHGLLHITKGNVNFTLDSPVVDNVSQPRPCPIDPYQASRLNPHQEWHYHGTTTATSPGQGLIQEPVLHQQTQSRVSGSDPLLPFQTVTTGIGSGSGRYSLSVLFDSGSTLSLINETVARGLGFHVVGHRTLNLIRTGGDSEVITTTVYEVPLRTCDGETVIIHPHGLRRISSDLECVNHENIERLFEIDTGSLRRPHGTVDLLVGTEVAGIHPVPISIRENLILGRSPFGLVVWGVQPAPKTSNSVTHTCLLTNATMDNFFQIETMGITCTPRCGACRCGKCALGAKSCTIQEERELDLIRSGLHYEEDHWVCTYPWIKDPKLLPDNYRFVLAQLYNLEKRLRKSPPLMKLYDQQVQDMITRNVARKCTGTELKEYSGPVYYLSHHEVLKETSASTPLRIVFNPAQNFKGHVLNEYWALGANLVQSIFDILIRFREYRVAIIGDISKMYHSVHTTPLEWHTHRFLWRDFEDRRPDIYIFLRNSFGDKPAGTIAIMAIRMTVERFGADHPRGSDLLTNSTYVDDLIDSRESEEQAQLTIRDADSLLSKGGFKVKNWITSSDPSLRAGDHSFANSELERVLGMNFDVTKDVFTFKMKLNFCRGKKRRLAESDLSQRDIPDLIPSKLTKRLIVSQVNGIYDVMGLISPFVVRAKILLRKIWMYADPLTNKKLDWDDAIPESLRADWICWFREAFEIETLSFPRCISPSPLPATDPTLVMFSDASMDAMAAVAFLRFEVAPDIFHSRLIASKTRVAPLQVKTIVQYEMQAAVMSKRLAVSITNALRLQLRDTFYIVDSEIVRAMISKENYGFNTWYAVRIGEIVSQTSPSQWYWVEGKTNIADWATRGRSPSELGANGAWQSGPDFLRLPTSQWPTKQSCSVSDLPGVKSHVTISCPPETVVRIPVAEVMDITRFGNISKLFRITARLLKVRESRSLLAMLREPLVKDYRKAEMEWIKSAQMYRTSNCQSLIDGVASGVYENLVPFIDPEGIIRVKGRVFSEEKSPILLPQQHRISRLIVEEVHSRNHDGIATVVAKTRELFWIVGAHRLAKTVRHHCVPCRRMHGQLQQQVMAELPTERTTVSLPFQHVSLDLFGPYDLLIPGKSTRGRQFQDEKKAYGVVYTCLSTRCIYVDAVRGYNLDAFLLTHRRFLSIRGAPDTLYSDCGTQLVAADKVLHATIMNNWDKDELIKHGVKFGVNWKFCAPDSPWQNGVSESLVKGVKRSLTLILGNHPRLTFEELQTALFEVSSLLNERPIGRHPNSPDECAFLRPNDLLLGRCSNRIPAGPWETPGGDLRKRFLLVQSVVNDWNKRWLRDFFPTLLPRKKWHTANRPVQIGDLVLIQDENLARGQWKLGQITKIHHSHDDRIRNVDIRYKNFPAEESNRSYRGSRDTIITRSVQRLVVIQPVEEL